MLNWGDSPTPKKPSEPVVDTSLTVEKSKLTVPPAPKSVDVISGPSITKLLDPDGVVEPKLKPEAFADIVLSVVPVIVFTKS